jgi:hypothetical protein
MLSMSIAELYLSYILSHKVADRTLSFFTDRAIDIETRAFEFVVIQ